MEAAWSHISPSWEVLAAECWSLHLQKGPMWEAQCLLVVFYVQEVISFSFCAAYSNSFNDNLGNASFLTFSCMQYPFEHLFVLLLFNLFLWMAFPNIYCIEQCINETPPILFSLYFINLVSFFGTKRLLVIFHSLSSEWHSTASMRAKGSLHKGAKTIEPSVFTMEEMEREGDLNNSSSFTEMCQNNSG